jgi:hypothetical protein
MWMTDGNRLRDATADVVADHAREIDPQEIQNRDEAIGVRAQPNAPGAGRIAAAKAKQVEYDHRVTGR